MSQIAYFRRNICCSWVRSKTRLEILRTGRCFVKPSQLMMSLAQTCHWLAPLLTWTYLPGKTGNKKVNMNSTMCGSEWGHKILRGHIWSFYLIRRSILRILEKSIICDSLWILGHLWIWVTRRVWMIRSNLGSGIGILWIVIMNKRYT